MRKKVFCVITVDIRRSKALTQRARIQKSLKQLTEKLNTQFKADLAAPFMITLGDEFQGATRNPEIAYPTCLMIQRNLRTRFYCGVGLGGVSTPISNRVVEMDGPAFHNSRDAIATAKKQNLELVIITRNDETDKVLNTLVSLIIALRNRWTERQKQVIEILEGKNVPHVEVARRLRISKQAVSKTLRTANYKEVKEGESILSRLLVNYTRLTAAGKPPEVY